jgi:hypothetical protein
MHARVEVRGTNNDLLAYDDQYLMVVKEPWDTILGLTEEMPTWG